MQLFANNVETTLVASLSSSATTMYVASTSGMPNPTGNDYFLLTLCKRDSNGAESSIEIVKCTAVVSNELTIIRAQEDTTGTAYASGDIASLRLTAGSLNDNIMQADGLPLAIGRINNPLLHLPLKNSLDMICGVGSVTFTRASSATYIDRYGVVQKVGNDVPRFEKEGLLIEGASTNKLLHSEDISNSYWYKQQGSATTSTITSPDGTNTAHGFISDSTTNMSHQVFSSTALSVDKTYSLSGFVKAGGKNYIRMHGASWTSDWVITGVAAVYFDLINGTIVNTYNSGGMTVLDAKIETLSNGWFRCSISFNIASGTDVYNTQTSFLPAISTSAYYYTGDGSTTEFYLWGAQLEEMPFATSYIPTTTAAATRTKDMLYLDAINSVAVTEEVTVLADFDIHGILSSTDAAKAQFVLYIHYLSAGTYCNLEAAYTEKMGGNIWSSFSTNYSCGVPVGGITYCLGATFESGYCCQYLNGERKQQRSVDTSGMDFEQATGIHIGHDRDGNRQLYGHISNFRIYDVALSEAEMRIA